MDSGESRFWPANLLNEMLYSKPSEEILAKIECRIDNHQLHDAAHSIRPIQDKSRRIETDLFRGILNRKELYDTDWMDKTNQIADFLAKIGSLSEKLLNSLETIQYQ